MTTPKRYTKGVTNVPSNAIMGQLGMSDPTKYHVFFDDFNHLDLSKWSFYGNVDGTEIVQDGDDGRMLITLPATEDTTLIMQAGDETGRESFTLESGKKLWFKTKFQINDGDQTDFALGLIARTASASTLFGATAANGVYFGSDDGDLNVDFYVRSGSATISANTAVGAIVDATDFTCGFYFNGVNIIEYFVGETNSAGTVETTSFPTTELLPVIGFMNGEAVANTLNVDYVCAIKER